MGKTWLVFGLLLFASACSVQSTHRTEQSSSVAVREAPTSRAERKPTPPKPTNKEQPKPDPDEAKKKEEARLKAEAAEKVRKEEEAKAKAEKLKADREKVWAARVEKKIMALGGTDEAVATDLYAKIKNKTFSPEKLSQAEYQFAKLNMDWLANAWTYQRIADYYESNGGDAILSGFGVNDNDKARRGKILVLMFWQDASKMQTLKYYATQARNKGGWSKLDSSEKADMNTHFKAIWSAITE